MAVDGLIIPRSYNDYFSRTEITQFNNAVKATTDATLNASSTNPIQNKAVTGAINEINGKIPTQASSTNKLADKEFVNSSVSTNTANYISDDGEPFASVAALEAYSGTVTNNDYAFVTGTDSEGNTYYDRYKATVNGASVSWAKEYRLNNSSFTAAQWDAIQSGITAAKVAQYDAAVGSNTVVPLGTTAGYEGNTDPADGQWFICNGRDTTGTAIELETHYPSFYIFLGGTNVLPEIFDHSKLSSWENKTISTNSASPTIMDYDGILFIQATRSGQSAGSNVKVYINGIEYKSNLDTSAYNIWGAYVTVPVKKGDSVYYTYNGDTLDRCGGWFYKQYKIIKATSSTDTQPIPSADIQTIEQYFDNGIQRVEQDIQAAQSYSTTETLTGGTWIDGKPIYRKVFTNVANHDTYLSIPNAETIISTLLNCSGSSIACSGLAFYRNMGTANADFRVSTSNNGTWANGTVVIEYTKTTD